MTYGEIAKEIGRPKASRAVGNACGKNPVCVIIPCQSRRENNDGGYSNGMKYKYALWKEEGIERK